MAHFRSLFRTGALLLALTPLVSCGSSETPPPQPVSSPHAAGPTSGPDFQVDVAAIAPSVLVEERDFSAADCAVQEGCVFGTGTRRLLLFEADIINSGTQDFYMGNPANNPNYTYSVCHQHYHLNNMMEYALIDPATSQPVMVSHGPVIARKQGFCLEDSAPYKPGAGAAKYDCSNQGISAGWEDIYDNSLDCQWLDITGVPPGKYLLRLTVNPDHAYAETNTANDVAEVPVTIN